MATEQAPIRFYTAKERADRLRKMVDKERRTQTVLLNEALDLLFASREPHPGNVLDHKTRA